MDYRELLKVAAGFEAQMTREERMELALTRVIAFASDELSDPNPELMIQTLKDIIKEANKGLGKLDRA